MKRTIVITFASTLVASALVLGQTEPNRLTVPFSDPSRPGTVKVNVLEGNITVKGANRRDVSVTRDGSETSGGVRGNVRNREDTSGLRRLGQPAGLNVEEDNNVISMSTGPRRGGDVEIEVPAKTNLHLVNVNGSRITVEGVEGE